MQNTRRFGLAAVAVLVVASLSSTQASAHTNANALPYAASASGTPQETITDTRAHELGYSLTPSKAEPFTVCPVPTKGKAECMSIVDPTPAARSQAEAESLFGLGPEPAPGPSYEGTGEEKGFSPSEIRKAYGISETGGSGQTVAIVDAYDDPNTESDLKVYRKEYGLSECTKANGCFKKVNQEGIEGAYPAADKGWAVEISLDVDMVSAVCPECKILLVEANNNEWGSLLAAEDEAATLKATEISNSWAGSEFSEETSDDQYFHHENSNHENIPITAAAGDHGYGVDYPAASPNVISVGGTTLKKAEKSSRGWEESVWGGSGGGCSAYETSKPTWQSDPSCANRTDNDVAAVANPNSPVSLYDSYETSGEPFYSPSGWLLIGGTSVATPIVAGIEAHAPSAVRAEGAKAFYRHSLFNVTAGSSGLCRGYLCNGEEGYSGPTGWGTPDGPVELAAGFHAVTARATSVSLGGATLNGYVDPEGLVTTYQFEYGKTTSYGLKAPESPASAGSGVVWKGVSQSVTELEPETTYHYRLLATNSSGTVYGADHTFSTTAWTVQSAHPGGYFLLGASCSSATACTAVGGGSTVSWNGTEWQTQSMPEPEGGGDYLYGVSCSLATACTAVGRHDKPNGGDGTLLLAERWNGTEWKIQSTPEPSEVEYRAELFGVSCSSATACTAVGQYEYYAGGGNYEWRVLAESWNGTEWKIQSAPEPSGAQKSALLSVSCSSANACMAVGYSEKVDYTPLAESWNGTEWKIQSAPEPHGAEGSELLRVSCSSATACTAVGVYYNSESKEDELLAERWNGTEWEIQSMPEPHGAQSSELTGVSCSSATACTAVGQATGEDLFAERWNGAEWQIQSMPMADESAGDQWWTGVSCTSPQVCVGVGAGGPLVEREIPPAITEPVSSVNATEAVLTGTVKPEGENTHYRFEYGTSESLGQSTPEEDIAEGTSTNVKVTRTVGHLTPDTKYYFRLNAVNSAGTAEGVDRTVTTTPASAHKIHYCHKTGPEEGAFREGKCAEASGSGEYVSGAPGISGALLTCLKVASGKGSFGNSGCTESGGSKSWEEIEVVWPRKLVGQAGTVVLKGKLAGATAEVTCTTGKFESQRKEEAELTEGKLELSSCTSVKPEKCTIQEPVVLGFVGRLEETGGKLVDKLTGSGTSKKFGEITYGGEKCVFKGESFPVEGSQVFEWDANSGKDQEKHELIGKTSGSSLTLGPEKATYEGTISLASTGGELWSAAVWPSKLEGSFGTTVLKSKLAGAEAKIECAKGTFEAAPEKEGETSVGQIGLSSCTSVKPAKCTVSVPALVFDGIVEESGGKLVDKLTGSGAGKELDEITYSGTECAFKGEGFPLKGSQTFEWDANIGKYQEKHELIGKTSGSSLTLGPEKATYEDTTTVNAEGGETWSAD
jgi:hypothetical protein